MSLKPLRNTFLFQFLNDTTSEAGMFVARSSGKILIAGANAEGQGAKPRWAKVLAIGDEVVDFSAGDLVLIEGGKWTLSFIWEGVRQWKSDDAWVLAVTDNEANTYDFVF